MMSSVSATQHRLGATLDGNLTSPPALRPVRRTWRDPRLAVGVVIVAASVLLGVRLVGGADATVGVWAVRTDLPGGTPLTAADLRREEVRFETQELADRYLPADQPPPEGATVARDLGAGELLPRDAVVTGRAGELVEVPVAVPAESVPATLRAGETVDVWVTPTNSGADTGADTGADAPRAELVLEGVRVVATPRTGTSLGPSAVRQVVVGVAPGQVPALAEALGRLATGTAVLVRRG